MNRMLDKFGLLHKIAIIIGGIVTVLLFTILRYYDINNLYLLPLCYTLSMFMVKDYFNNANMGLAVSIIEITKVLRYVIQPLTYVLSDTYVRYDLQPSYHSTAVLLMCYELLAVSIVMFLFIKRHRLHEIRTRTDYKQSFSVYAIAIAWIFLVLFVGYYRDRLLNFSITENIGLSNSSSDGGSFILTYLFMVGIIYIFALLISLSYYTKESLIKFLIILFAAVFYISSNWNKGGESISRWGLILGFIMSIYVLYTFYPKRKNLIIYGGVSLIVVFVALSSMLKLLVWGYDVSTISDSSKFIFTSDMFDLYFQGVYSVSNGLASADKYADCVGYINFIDEFLNHFPGAYQIFGFNNYNIAEVYFKASVNDNALICPSLIQSYFYLGVFGSPFFSCLSVYFALLFSEKLLKESNVTIRFFYISSIYWLALYNCINFAIVEAHIWYYMVGILLCRRNIPSMKSKQEILPQS